MPACGGTVRIGAGCAGGKMHHMDQLAAMPTRIAPKSPNKPVVPSNSCAWAVSGHISGQLDLHARDCGVCGAGAASGMHDYGAECKKSVWQLAKGASEQDSRVQRGPRGKRTMRETAGWSVGSGLCTKNSVEEFLICIEELKVYFRVVHHFSYFQ